MFRASWQVLKPLMSPPVSCLRELNLTEERKEVGCIKTGAKVYGLRKGARVWFWVSGYAPDYSDIKDVVKEEQDGMRCHCGKLHMLVKPFGDWCCPDNLE